MGGLALTFAGALLDYSLGQDPLLSPLGVSPLLKWGAQSLRSLVWSSGFFYLFPTLTDSPALAAIGNKLGYFNLIWVSS